jgi:hypothetical protein
MYKDIAKNLEKFNIEYPNTIIPAPSESDYKLGFIRRYFVRRANDEYGHIFEISKDVYNKYSKSPFWITQQLKWRISGPLNQTLKDNGDLNDMGVLNSNKISLSEASVGMRNLKLYLPNLLQLYKK